MARTRPGPAATAPWPRRGARDVHGVGWSTVGQLGWLATAWNVADQFAAAAAALPGPHALLDGLWARREGAAEQGILPGGKGGGGTRVGRDGRFRIEGLVPGLKYDGGTGEGFRYFVVLFHDLTVTPGEVKDLGDLKVVPPSGTIQ